MLVEYLLGLNDLTSESVMVRVFLDSLLIMVFFNDFGYKVEALFSSLLVLERSLWLSFMVKTWVGLLN